MLPYANRFSILLGSIQPSFLTDDNDDNDENHGKSAFVATVILLLQMGTGIDILTIFGTTVFTSLENDDTDGVAESLLTQIYIGVVFVMWTSAGE